MKLIFTIKTIVQKSMLSSIIFGSLMELQAINVSDSNYSIGFISFFEVHIQEGKESYKKYVEYLVANKINSRVGIGFYGDRLKPFYGIDSVDQERVLVFMV